MDPRRRNTICGIPNSVFIYIMGVLSLCESVTFLCLNIFIFLLIDGTQDFQSDIWWIDENVRPQHITLLFIPFNFVRIFVALALIIGRITNNATSLPIFVIFTVLGIGANLGAGSVAASFQITYNIGVGTLSVVVLHAVYVLIGSKIFFQERASSRNKVPLDDPVSDT